MNQKRILEAFARERDFANLRYCTDDSWNDANFKNLDLQKMQLHVEAGKVSTVVLKDISRLMLNYLHVKAKEVMVILEKLAKQKGNKSMVFNTSLRNILL